MMNDNITATPKLHNGQRISSPQILCRHDNNDAKLSQHNNNPQRY